MQPTQLLFLFSMQLYIALATMSNFKIEECHFCQEGDKLNFFIRPRNFNPGLQLVDINMSTPLAFGYDATAKALFEVISPLGNNHWVYLFDMEDEFCKTLDRYVGELWYDIQRALGVMPHSCPLPRGSYHAINYRMDYQKLKLQTFPFGKIRITLNVQIKTRPEIKGCMKLIVSYSA